VIEFAYLNLGVVVPSAFPAALGGEYGVSARHGFYINHDPMRGSRSKSLGVDAPHIAKPGCRRLQAHAITGSAIGQWGRLSDDEGTAQFIPRHPHCVVRNCEDATPTGGVVDSHLKSSAFAPIDGIEPLLVVEIRLCGVIYELS
jgi:hypothetical protein